MKPSRRRLLQTVLHVSGIEVASMLGLLAASPRALGAPLETAPRRFREALALEIGDAEPQESHDLVLEVPEIAEDGAIVPVTVESRIRATDRLSLFVERNPFPLIAAFHFAQRAAPFASLRIKMQESSTVIVIGRAQGKYYRTSRWVRVVRGGCG